MTETFISWGPWGLAASAFLAGSVAPLPSEAVLLALVALGAGPLSMSALATAANVAGAATLVALGRAGRPYAERKAAPAALARAEGLYRRYGTWTLLLSWVPLAGDLFVLAAGLAGVSWPRAVALLALGKGARYAAVALGALSLR